MISKISEGYFNVSSPNLSNFGIWDKASTLGEGSGSKTTGNVLLGDRLDILESGSNRGVRLARLHVG